MRSDRQLIALHAEMRKVAFERLGASLVEALNVKAASAPPKEPDNARSR